ncbi:MAG: cyclic nucleotide-binding domain-containing protein [Myxococcaceae bacterium]
MRSLALAIATRAPVPPPPSFAPLFGGLSPQAFSALAGALELRVSSAGAPVVTEGEAGASLFAIAHGSFEVTRAFEGGARRSVARLGEGDLFGEIGLVAGTPRLATVVSSEPGVLLELTRAALDEVAARHPGVEEAVQAFFRAQLLRNVLQSNPLFTPLSPPQREELAGAFELRTAMPGEHLLKEGEVGAGLFLLLRGRCTPSRARPGLTELKHPEMLEGDVFGEISLLLGKPVAATVSAEADCTLLFLSRAAFEGLVLSHPALRAQLTRMSFERLQRSAKLLSGRFAHPGDSRV